MITATKGKKMSFQISIERGGKKELSKDLCSLEVLSLPKAADFSEGEEVGLKKQNASSFSNRFILAVINYGICLD